MARKKAKTDLYKKPVPNVRLRKAREQRNLKQSELAEKIGVSTITVNRWENGKSIPTSYYRQELCDFFRMDSEALGLIPPEESERVFPQNSLPGIWNVPYRHNPFFTGREAILKRIHALRGSSKVTVLTQTQAISGLGGIGKTQAAVEYAYRYHKEYKVVLWVRADSSELIISDFIAIAHKLNLQEKDEQDQMLIVDAVKRWLREHRDWLLIFDNADDVQVVSDFVDSLGGGHVLLTTRAQNAGKFAQRIEVKKMEPEEGARFLLRRANVVDLDTPLDNGSKVDRDRAREISEILGGLPLALDQAGAYIQETACGLDGYLDRYRERSIQLFGSHSLRGESDHPESIIASLSLSFAKVEQANPVAADLMRFCAFLQPDAIPEEIILEDMADPDQGPGPATAARYKLDYAIGELRRFSLIERDSHARTLTMHRLVQEVLKYEMNEAERRQWAERAVRTVNRVFPGVQVETWPQCQRYLSQAQACAELINRYELAFPEAARLLDLTGRYLHERGRYDEAGPFLHDALAIREQVLEPEHIDIAASLNDLASLYQSQGKYELAESLYRRALAIREKMLGPEHTDTATSLNDLASLYQDQGKYERAEPFYRRALAIRERVLGPEHADTAISLNGLAVLYADQGKYEQAEILSQRDLEIKEKVVGPLHPDVAISLSNMGGFYHAEGKYKQAEPLYQRALAIFERVLGPEHAHTAVSLDSLAELYLDQGKYKQAEALSRRALAVFERALGLEHPEVCRSLITLALLNQAQGKYEQAEAFFRRSLSIYEKALGPEHAYTAGSLTYLAMLYTDQGKYEQAEPLSRRALAIKEKVLGPEHPSTATSLNNLAKLYQVRGNYEQAEALCQRALAIREKVPGLQHPDTASSLTTLADIYTCRERYQEAEQLYQRALAICAQFLMPEHPEVTRCLESYATLLRKMGREDEASDLIARAGAIRFKQAQAR